MNIFKLFVGHLSRRSLAMTLYKQGLARVAKRDLHGAMAAFTSAIESPEAPEDVKAMALYNRALLLDSAGQLAKALIDLNAVMTMSAELCTIKLAARRRLERMKRQKESTAGAHLNARAAK